jgi:hypothetical protein
MDGFTHLETRLHFWHWLIHLGSILREFAHRLLPMVSTLAKVLMRYTVQNCTASSQAAASAAVVEHTARHRQIAAPMATSHAATMQAITHHGGLLMHGLRPALRFFHRGGA